MPKHLTNEQTSQFRESGYVKPIRVLDEQQVEQAQRMFAEHTQVLKEHGLTHNDVNGWWAVNRSFMDVCTTTAILDCLEDLLGPNLLIWGGQYFAKMPGDGKTVPWHQDGGYAEKWHKATDGRVGELSMVNVWAPLVPARVENGCMQFIPGTHRIGLLPHEQREFHLEIPAASIESYSDRILDIELDPGDVVVFHNMLCHRALPNRSDSIRWSMDWRYQDATEPTLREEKGHMARSQCQPASVVASASQWESLSFC